MHVLCNSIELWNRLVNTFVSGLLNYLVKTCNNES